MDVSTLYENSPLETVDRHFSVLSTSTTFKIRMATQTGPVYKGHQTVMVTVTVVMTFFGGKVTWSLFPFTERLLNCGVISIALAVILRVIGRCMFVQKLGADDWWMLFGLVFLPE